MPQKWRLKRAASYKLSEIDFSFNFCLLLLLTIYTLENGVLLQRETRYGHYWSTCIRKLPAQDLFYAVIPFADQFIKTGMYKKNTGR